MNIFAEFTLEKGLLLTLTGAAAGYGLSWWLQKRRHEAGEAAMADARRKADDIIRDAHLRAEEGAKLKKAEADLLIAEKAAEIRTREERASEREGLVNRQLENIVQQEQTLRHEHEELEHEARLLKKDQAECEATQQTLRHQLERLARINESEARALLLKDVEASSLRDAAQISRNILDDAKMRAEEKAKRIISVAIQRYAGQHTFETSTATVALSGEDIKGRIIGREGRNIRAFEAATGVTVLIDDTPNAVVLSGFDPVRREIAREAMERLILDGRIHPTRIEEIVGKVTQEIDEAILHAGEDALQRSGLPMMHLEIVKLLGRLKFRHSFSQNILNHSVEVAHLTGLMAAELGLDVQEAKRTGLLHDIGKAVNHEIEGAHALVGADILKRYGESEMVVAGVASHHDEAPHLGLFGILVGAADAISASRPGARSETMATYIKRVEDLERIGLSFPGVEKCYAFQAGRELRVVVKPEDVNDEQAYNLARGVARKIEDDLQYPGQIRITIVRETRCVEFAK